MFNNHINTFKKRYYKFLENQSSFAKLNVLRQHISERKDLILVHQMGRAASMSTVNTIRSLKLSQPVYHTHWLNPNSVNMRVERVNAMKYAGTGPLNVRVSELLSPEIEHHLENRQWKIVSIVREPIARNISAFFLDIERFFPDFFIRYQNNEIPFLEIKDVFLEEFDHKMPLDWFEIEVEDIFGIDVFDVDYYDNRGYLIAGNENVSLLVIKLERLNECYGEAFFNFFGKKPDYLVNTHVTDHDKRFNMYQNFINNVVLPDAYLTKMYNCQYVNHFFSPAEIAEFKLKWSNKGA